MENSHHKKMVGIIKLLYKNITATMKAGDLLAFILKYNKNKSTENSHTHTQMPAYLLHIHKH